MIGFFHVRPDFWTGTRKLTAAHRPAGSEHLTSKRMFRAVFEKRRRNKTLETNTSYTWNQKSLIMFQSRWVVRFLPCSTRFLDRNQKSNGCASPSRLGTTILLQSSLNKAVRQLPTAALCCANLKILPQITDIHLARVLLTAPS